MQSRGGVEVRNRLFLADLGGSEKLSRSDAGKEIRSLVITQGGEEISPRSNPKPWISRIST